MSQKQSAWHVGQVHGASCTKDLLKKITRFEDMSRNVTFDTKDDLKVIFSRNPNETQSIEQIFIIIIVN